MKAILFIGGGEETLPAIHLAKSMQLKTIVIDYDVSCPCFSESDFQIVCSTYDVDSCVRESKNFNNTVHKISGVICVANDVPLSVASVASELKLPGIPVTAAKIASDKILMKDHFKKHGISIPWYKEIFSISDLRKEITDKNQVYVIKPVDSRGARGVQKINVDSNFEAVFNEAIKNSPSKRVMIEEFIGGPQLSSESIVYENKSYTIGLSDRNYELLEKFAPHIIEDGGDLPASLNENQKKNVEALIEDISSALEISNGVIKGDIVFDHNSDIPIVIEVATRLSGGYFCSHEIPMSTGVDFLSCAIKLSLGEPINLKDLEIKASNFICQRYLFSAEGVVAAVPKIDNILNLRGIKFLSMRIQVGDIIKSTKSHPGRAGVVIAEGSSREQAKENANNAILEMQKQLIVR
jgi:biotin carboxylase